MFPMNVKCEHMAVTRGQSEFMDKMPLNFNRH